MRGTVCVGDGWVVETGASVPRFGVALICLSVCLAAKCCEMAAKLCEMLAKLL